MAAKYFVVIIIIFFSLDIYSSEYGSWWQQTPGGNTMAREKSNSGYIIGIECNNVTVYSDQNGHIITGLKKWFFYKNHIVGFLQKSGQENYFIFSEVDCRIDLFDSQDLFYKELKSNKLMPFIWTRWHTKNYGLIITDSKNIGDHLFFVIIQMPLLIVFLLYFIIVLVKTKFNINRRLNKFNIVIIGCLFFRILLDLFPNSF